MKLLCSSTGIIRILIIFMTSIIWIASKVNLELIDSKKWSAFDLEMATRNDENRNSKGQRSIFIVSN